MSSTNPQDYDPYLDKLQEYQRKLKELYELLKSKQSQINQQDYKILINQTESFLKEIEKDIEKRKTQETPDPGYGDYKRPWFSKSQKSRNQKIEE